MYRTLLLTHISKYFFNLEVNLIKKGITLFTDIILHCNAKFEKIWTKKLKGKDSRQLVRLALLILKPREA